MRHDVSGLLGGERQVGERGCAGVVVTVVAVGFRPAAGVEHAESAFGGDQHVASVAGRGEAVETVECEVVDDGEFFFLDDEDAAVVGQGEARLRRRHFGSGGGGRRLGGVGRSGVGLGRTAAGGGEGRSDDGEGGAAVAGERCHGERNSHYRK